MDTKIEGGHSGKEQARTEVPQGWAETRLGRVWLKPNGQWRSFQLNQVEASVHRSACGKGATAHTGNHLRGSGCWQACHEEVLPPLSSLVLGPGEHCQQDLNTAEAHRNRGRAGGGTGAFLLQRPPTGLAKQGQEVKEENVQGPAHFKLSGTLEL